MRKLLILSAMCFGFWANSQMIVDSFKLFPSYPYADATAHYTLRNVNSLVEHVVRVRRSSDNAESDFTSDEVSDGTLTTWTGANDGFVVTFYDQTGNDNHATNTTDAEQMPIVESGSLVTTTSGHPSVHLNLAASVSDGYYMDDLNGGVDLSDASIFGVFEKSSTSANNRQYGFGHRYFDSSSSGKNHLNPDSDNSIRFDGAFISGSLTPATGEYIRSTFKVSTAYYDYLNSTNNINGSTVTDGGIYDNFHILTGASSTVLDDYFCEAIIFLDDQRTNRSTIESELNAHYSIF